ncbi:Gfo/Idh/MocA family oxidoreductase [Oscillatoria amoena NRMC-F 0135]|nr:Gfo/Idh/MocA family oxidoreductase [Oscillatoria amoena NRMC-F 0135]
MTMEEGCQCLDLIEGSGVMTALGFNLRYEGMYEQLRELLQGEEIHLVRTVCTIDYYLNFHMSPWFLQKAISGGPIAEQAIHPLDCVRYVLGGRQARRALLAGEKNMAMERTEFDAENALQLIYELEGGIYGTHMNHCGHERFCFDLEFVGPHLRLTAHAMDSHIKGFMRGKEVMIARRPLSTGLGKVQSWLEAIKTGNRDLIRSDYRDALKTLALVEAALKSHQTRSFEKVEAL